MVSQIYEVNPGSTDDEPNGSGDTRVPIAGAKKPPRKDKWSDLSSTVRSRLSSLLSNQYLESKRGPVSSKKRKPLAFPSVKKDIGLAAEQP